MTTEAQQLSPKASQPVRESENGVLEDPMSKKRPCRFCRRWFRPDPRLGVRQYACSRPECQRERHRRNCVDYRRRDPDFARREERVRSHVVKVTSVPGTDERIDWDEVRSFLGTDAMVILQESGRDTVRRLRDSTGAESRVVAGRSGKVSQSDLRDSIDSDRTPP